MAATLTDTGELTYLSFGIDKVESTPDGDLMCYGRATDGSVDHDQQIVDPQFSSKSIREWLESGGNVRVQHNAQRDPAGVGLEVSTDPDGATWVKSLIVEPVAKKLLTAGALRAYSVGIARPTIVRDAVAKGGRITDGQVVEISLVDRPANARCGIQLVKSADDGTPEYVGKMFGADDAIAKALDGDVTKAAPPGDDLVNVDLPRGASISISPADFAALRTFKQQLVTKAAAGSVAEKRDVSTAERRSLASEGDALPDGSYPIGNAGDLHNAAHLARTGHGDVAAARRLIARRARELGVANPLDADDDVKKGSSEGDGMAALPLAPADPVKAPLTPVQTSLAEKAEAEPEVTKDPEPEAKDKPVKKAKKPKKLPPWLNKPTDGDGDSDDDGKAEKRHTTPAEAGGVSASPMDPAPAGDLVETPAPASCKADGSEEPAGPEAAAKSAPDLAASPEVAALIRFKAAGIDPEPGRLHDLTCPAFHPETAAKYHPYADLRTAIDLTWFQQAAVKAAAGGSLEHAMAMQQVWQAAGILKNADPAWVNDCRLAAHKAFRDANPGPGSAPTPGHVSPQRFCRPLITDGHAAASSGHDGPNTSPQVASSAPNAHSFDRPPLSAGHQSPSPSFMKWQGGEYPVEQGVPVQLSYAHMEKDQARMALVRVHDQISRQFPEVCPLDSPDARPLRGQQPEHHPVPPIAGIGKAAAEPNAALTGPDAETERGRSLPERPQDAVVPDMPAAKVTAPAAAFKATPEEDGDFFGDAEVYKSFKKMRKKLGKKVLSGKMTVDEARAHLGRQFAQKGAEPEPEVAKAASAVSFSVPGAEAVYNMSGAVDPAVIKAAVREALRAESVPLEPATVAAFDPSPAIEAAVTKAVTPLLEKIQAQDTKLAETQRVIDAIADQPDPSTAAFSGLAFKTPVQKGARPAGVPDIAESAARAQDMIRRNLQSTYYTHSSPAVREAASEALAKLGMETLMT